MVSSSSITSENSLDRELDFGLAASITFQVERMLQVRRCSSTNAALQQALFSTTHLSSTNTRVQQTLLFNKRWYCPILVLSNTLVSNEHWPSTNTALQQTLLVNEHGSATTHLCCNLFATLELCCTLDWCQTLACSVTCGMWCQTARSVCPSLVTYVIFCCNMLVTCLLHARRLGKITMFSSCQMASILHVPLLRTISLTSPHRAYAASMVVHTFDTLFTIVHSASGHIVPNIIHVCSWQ